MRDKADPTSVPLRFARPQPDRERDSTGGQRASAYRTQVRFGAGDKGHWSHLVDRTGVHYVRRPQRAIEGGGGHCETVMVIPRVKGRQTGCLAAPAPLLHRRYRRGRGPRVHPGARDLAGAPSPVVWRAVRALAFLFLPRRSRIQGSLPLLMTPPDAPPCTRWARPLCCSMCPCAAPKSCWYQAARPQASSGSLNQSSRLDRNICNSSTRGPGTIYFQRLARNAKEGDAKSLMSGVSVWVSSR